MMKEKVKTAIIPVAGSGLRALPGSKTIPKHFHMVNGRPVIDYAIQEALSAGVEEFVFVIGPDPIERILLERQFLEFDHAYIKLAEKGMFAEIEELQKSDLRKYKVSFVTQEEPLGLGHAVLCAEKYISDDRFIVICPDDLLLPNSGKGLRKLLNSNNKHACVLTEEVKGETLSLYGVLQINKDNQTVDGVMEKPSPKDAPSNYAIMGRYLLPREVLSLLEDAYNDFLQGKHQEKEIGLTEVLNALAKDSRLSFYVASEKRYDCGNKLGHAKANAYFLEKPRKQKRLPFPKFKK